METKEQLVARWEAEGWLVRDCLECQEFYKASDPRDCFAPQHRASKHCESGGKDHCSCDHCF